MNTKILSLTALLFLSVAPAFGQLLSSPLEPGIYDYMRSRHTVGLRLIDMRRMIVDATEVEWVSPDQITVSATVIDIRGMSAETRRRVMQRVEQYNSNAAVGTLAVVDGTVVKMTHFLNPRQTSHARISTTIVDFGHSVEHLKKELSAPEVVQKPLRFIE